MEPKKNILFVDDEEEVLNGLRRNLRSERHVWECYFVTSGFEALAKCNEVKFDLIVTDGKMPGMSGSELLANLREREDTKYIPAIMLTGFYEDELRKKALESGVIEFLNKPVVPQEFILRINNVLRMKSVSDQLREKNKELEQKNKELEETRMQVIRRLGKATEYRDNETGQHVIRVAHYTRIISEAMNLPEDLREMLFLVAPMHDIGKIGIPDSILRKPGALDPFEYEIMSHHTELGENVLKPFTTEELEIYRTHPKMGEDILKEENTPMLQLAATVALYHHEKWDGTGYPNKVKGEDIPLVARIVAVCDVFDALSSKRHYKPALDPMKCREIIEGMSGTAFDPQVVKVFLEKFDEILGVLHRFKD